MNENIEQIERNIEYIEGSFFKDDGTAADDELGMSLEAMKKALALLKDEPCEPCETCGGSGEVMPDINDFICTLNYIDAEPIRCPACQSQEKLPGFKDIIGLYADDESKEPCGNPDCENGIITKWDGPKSARTWPCSICSKSQEPAATIAIHLIGTKGQLDKPEGEYGVLNLKDVAERAKQLIIQIGTVYKNYGWSVISGQKGEIPKDCIRCEHFHHNKKDDHCFRYTQQPENCQQIKSQEPAEFVPRSEISIKLMTAATQLPYLDSSFDLKQIAITLIEAAKSCDRLEAAEKEKNYLADGIEKVNNAGVKIRRELEAAEKELKTYQAGNVPVHQIIADNEAMALELEQLQEQLKTANEKIGNAKDIINSQSFYCELADKECVGMKSIVYLVDKALKDKQ